VVEQSDEFRYATEYSAPGRTIITKSLAAKGGSSDRNVSENQKPPHLTSALETVPGSEGKEAATPVPPGESAREIETTTTIMEGIPTAFETRNLGVTFEVEPVVGASGRTIDLNLVPQHVRLLGMRKAEIDEKGSNKKVVVEQPEILNNRITTSIQVVDNEYTLLGVFKLNDVPETMELFILHTQLKTIEAPVDLAPIVPNPESRTAPDSANAATPTPGDAARSGE
jgi:hypothetical protein